MDTFYPRLDGLRAFAVVAVMVYHWHHPTVLGRELPLGFAGVQLFFVLSGFLIGGILLRSQDRNEREATSQAFTLRQFVIRRAIRIFPAYFVFLALTALVLGPADRAWWWYPLYLSNFRMAATPGWPDYWAHTWTLAVEEQFYIVAPILVLFLKRKPLALVLPGLVGASGLFVLLLPASRMTLVPPNAFYGLLLGMALALLVERRSASNRSVSSKELAVCASLSVGISMFAFVLEIHDGRLLAAFAPIAFASLVLWATGTGPVGRFLEWKPLMHLGGIAYGLYLWHMPVPFLWQWLELPAFPNQWVTFIFFGLFTYALALLSWTLVEKPLNRHKGAFPYHRPVANAPTEPQPAAL